MLVIVTGASKGIGYELVKRFSEFPELRVVAISRNINNLNKLAKTVSGSRIVVIKADITDKSHQKTIYNQIKTLKAPLHILIHNAGLLLNKAFHKITFKELESVYSVNVFAPFMLTQLFLPFMKPGSHIVNISSMGGFQGSSKFPGLSAYSSSKAALSGFTECLAEELKPKNISVNCLALGAVQTEMLAKAFPGFKAPLSPAQMAEFICDFSLNGHRFFNGKILPVSSTTP
jgi:3-oxoacyl-[acyl-carrier protein] reductase